MNKICKIILSCLISLSILRPFSTTQAKEGWYIKDGSWYYEDETGKNKTGWLFNGKDWFYLDENGRMLVDEYLPIYSEMDKVIASIPGFFVPPIGYYYFNNDGIMVTGINKDIYGNIIDAGSDGLLGKTNPEGKYYSEFAFKTDLYADYKRKYINYDLLTPIQKRIIDLKLFGYGYSSTYSEGTVIGYTVGALDDELIKSTDAIKLQIITEKDFLKTIKEYPKYEKMGYTFDNFWYNTTNGEYQYPILTIEEAINGNLIKESDIPEISSTESIYQYELSYRGNGNIHIIPYYIYESCWDENLCFNLRHFVSESTEIVNIWE